MLYYCYPFEWSLKISILILYKMMWNGCSGSIFWGVQLRVIQVLNDQNTLIVQSILQNTVKKIKGHALLSSLWSTLNSLLWSGTGAIMKVRDPMQNPGQSRIFCKPGQTNLTRTKRDQITRSSFNPDINPSWFLIKSVFIYKWHF